LDSSSGNSPLSGEGAYDAIVQAARDAVQAAISSNNAQRVQAGQWFTAGLPEDPQAHPVGDSNAPNL
jgi:hypothetical protein